MILGDDVQVVLIDDDQHVLDSSQHLLELAGYKTKAFLDPHKALQQIHPNWSGVILTDIYMPTMSGMELIDKVKAISPHLPIITITGHGDIEMAVEAIQKGASDYLEKPLKPKKLLSLLEKVISERSKVVEQWHLIERDLPKKLLGKSVEIVEIRERIKLLAMADKDVLIEGENGVGRYTSATLLHELSPRQSGPLLFKVGDSLATVTELETLIKDAENGTIILNEPSKMPEEVQGYLSRYLLEQERSGKHTVKFVSIFSQAPELALQEHTLLPELYYLLNNARFSIPPLRKRKEDIKILFKHFLKNSCLLLSKEMPKVDSSYLNTLNDHCWPGNVRELKSVAELYAIGIVKLSVAERVYPVEQMDGALDELVEKYERQLIEDALYLFSGQINDVSNYLQIQRKKLYLRMKKYGLDKANYKRN
ncbi:two-component system response regulator [Photobacterium jeanii]|uniref:Two-component system response regulator n=1 Tax=Photobacterium jeanii TaxID=858640 RepID=A0A178K190_9GAMM|nr:sigma-54 dependent transcriptional regulator [Photobacterium jeanii]OAN10876.1 two-component system response regulator [Photobacterium jeanii]PST90391.1 sigma-54-dependent Fis family transcriptional regulator [Photobacterium jeanii]